MVFFYLKYNVKKCMRKKWLVFFTVYPEKCARLLHNRLLIAGIAENNLKWFENCLKDQEQFVCFEHNSTKKATVTCVAPRGFI